MIVKILPEEVCSLKFNSAPRHGPWDLPPILMNLRTTFGTFLAKTWGH